MKEKDKALVILTPGFPASDHDTSCLPMLQSLTRSLNDQFPGTQILVIAFHYPFRKDVYECAGAEVHSMNGRNRGHIFRLLLKSKVQKKLQILYREKSIIGMLSCWYGDCAESAQQFSSRIGLKHYCWLLGQDARPGNRIVARVGLQSKQLIALSDNMAKEFNKNYGINPANVIPPGLPLSTYQFPERERDIDISGVGSLIPLKRFELIIQIVSSIVQVYPNLRCVIIGKGPEKEKIMDLIVSHKLQSNVFLLGELPRDKVLEFMSRTRVLLHPSSYEGFSGVCMEALACGAHVVSFTKAMDYTIDHWHIVRNESEMKTKAIQVLAGASHEPIRDFPIELTAWRLMEVFGEEPSMQEKASAISSWAPR